LKYLIANRIFMLRNGLIILLSNIFFYGMLHATENINTQESSNAGYKNCGENDKARLLAKLVINSPDQKRKSISCHSDLSQIAQEKAEEMAAAGKVSHYGAGGSPDERLIKSGYKLYLPRGATGLNHVEAILGGYSEADIVLANFSNSYHHRVHLFAEHPFFLTQDDIGVGYAREWNSPHVDYWVVYIAKDKGFAINKSMFTNRELEGKEVLVIGKPMK